MNLPVAEQSIILAVFMMFFIAVHIGVSIVGLVMIFIWESQKFRLNDIIILIIPVILLCLYLGIA